MKPYTGQNIPEGWRIYDEDIPPRSDTENEIEDQISVKRENDNNNDLSGDFQGSWESQNVDISEPKVQVTTSCPTETLPVTSPRRTRCGRSVKKPNKYSRD